MKKFLSKILKEYPISTLIYSTHDCCIYKSKNPDNRTYKIIKINPYSYEQYRILKAVSILNNPHLLVPEAVEKYHSFTVSLYPQKTSVIDKITNESLTFDELFALILDLCDGILCLHSNNILHLDISPNNIYVNDDGSFCLGDFSASQKKNKNNHRKNLFFTDGYSPPEFSIHTHNALPINELCDEYSLAKTILSLCHAQSYNKDTIDTTKLSDIPENFISILNKAASDIQEYRYPSITAFINAMLDFKEKNDISKNSYCLCFNRENNPFNALKTKPFNEHPDNVKATSKAHAIFNSPAFMTIVILAAILFPVLTIYKVLYATPPDNIYNKKISALYETHIPESTPKRIQELDFKNSKITCLSAENIKNVFGSDIDPLFVTAISANNNTVSDIKELSVFSSVEELYLSGNSIEDISELKQLSKLKTLILSSNKISDISVLDTLKSLEILDISDNQNITDHKTLCKLGTLKLLCLNDTNISPEHIKIIKKYLPECEIIY